MWDIPKFGNPLVRKSCTTTKSQTLNNQILITHLGIILLPSQSSWFGAEYTSTAKRK
jgi:hypothetical protein